jgi:phage terminase Nu1 subunit (DNA packaging protein)
MHDEPPPLVLGATMSENAAAKVYWQAKKVELDFRKAAAELVPAADVRSELETVFRACRGRLLRVPNQARQLLPALSAADAVVLENLIRETLEGLASGQEVTA